jgi:hypothetical protein
VGSTEHHTEPFGFTAGGEMFMNVTATIHSSKRILLLDVKLKMQNTSKGTPNSTCFMFHVFRVVVVTIHAKTVPVQFQTEAQCFRHLFLLPLSRDGGGRENL